MLLLCATALLTLVCAETGADGWLRYRLYQNTTSPVPQTLHISSTQGSPLATAGKELQDGFASMFDKQLGTTAFTASSCSADNRIVVTTLDLWNSTCGALISQPVLHDGFYFCKEGSSVKIIGYNERAALYGAYEYLSKLSLGEDDDCSYVDNPAHDLRMINHWDDLDGSTLDKRGNGSMFFADGRVEPDLDAIPKYGRFLASVRYNVLVPNNVNADPVQINATNLVGMAQIADALRPYGVQLGLSLNFASPMRLGNLSTYDPLDPSVITWWSNKTEEIYKHIPDLAIYLVKADSEGQPGPLVYNRTLADGANIFAKLLAPHSGVLAFRTFLYTSQNYSDWTADRCAQPVEYLADLDGQFEDNVILQTKYGSLDFQVQEPPNPLFSTMRKSNLAMEVETSQEYLGQQSHFVYEPPLWKTIFDFDLRVDGKQTMVKDIISGSRISGFAVVATVRNITTWQLNVLAMSNLYASGRFAWNPSSDAEQVLRDWAGLTFSNKKVVDTIANMGMDSWPAFRNYSGNLGIGSLAAVYSHYGPDPDSADGPRGSRWFRHYADSIGMDRTVANGTGYSGQFEPEVAAMFENVETTPEDLLLWFHHLPYSHVLSSGKTIIQYIYDAHFSGAAKIQRFVSQWSSLQGLIDQQRYSDTLRQLTYQAGHSIVWRDSITSWFYNATGIDDEQRRVGNHPYRIQAEAMQMSGYTSYPVKPFECADNYTAATTSSNSTGGRLSIESPFDTGVYDLSVNYFDLIGGNASYVVSINNNTIATFAGNRETWDNVASIYVDGHSAIRQTFKNVEIAKEDVISIDSVPNGNEAGPIDYVLILPQGYPYTD